MTRWGRLFGHWTDSQTSPVMCVAGVCWVVGWLVVMVDAGAEDITDDVVTDGVSRLVVGVGAGAAAPKMLSSAALV